MYPEHLQKYIPPEFNLKNYSRSANMDLVYWFDNLMSRAGPFEFYMSDPSSFDHYGDLEEEKFKGFAEFANRGLRSEELFESNVTRNIENGALIDPTAYSFIKAAYVHEGKGVLSVVKSMTYHDLLQLREKYLTEEIENKYSNLEISLFPSEEAEKLGELNHEILTKNADDEVYLSWLKIDMRCTDKEILTAFNDWLKQTRISQKKDIVSKRREHKIKILNKTTFRKWHDANVLAYIDLVTWNFFKNNKLTNKVVGEILYPDPKNLADKAKIIEDTTHPYACQLTSSVFLTRMLNVALETKPEEN